MNEEEIWKTVPGYPHYEVSNLGKVRSLKAGNVKLLTQFMIGRYYGVNISNKFAKRKTWTTYVHHLVSIAFLDHWPKKGTTVINHIDGDRLNNRLDNLELLTFRENLQKGWERKGRNTQHFGAHKTIRVRKTTGETIEKWKAAACHKNVTYYLGQFDTELEAKAAYDNFVASLNEKIELNHTPTVL